MATLTTSYGTESVDLQMSFRNNRQLLKIKVLSRPFCVELFTIDKMTQTSRGGKHLLNICSGEKKYQLSFPTKAEASDWECRLKPLTQKQKFIPPKPLFERKVTEFYLCPRDGFLSNFKACDTKAVYCSANCTCDQVCTDSACSANCLPNCSCDAYCRDCVDCSNCDDRGCYMDKPECYGHCLVDWE